MGVALVGAAVVGTAGAAQAQTQTQTHNWSGFYVGVNGGGGQGKSDARFAGTNTAGNLVVQAALGGFGDLSVPFSGSISSDPQGFIGGVQGGYNWQIGRTAVVGLEADIQYSDIHGTGLRSQVTFGNTFATTTHQDLNWFGTLRARAGVQLDDKLLLYATGGLAFGDTRNSAQITQTGGPGIFAGIFPDGSGVRCVTGQACMSGARSGTSLGYTFGAGIEWAVTNNVRFKAEWLHVDLGTENVGMRNLTPVAGDIPAAINARFDNQYEVFRAGLNYKF